MPTLIPQLEVHALHARPSAAKVQIVGLDVVRFLAAFLVVFFHLAYWNHVGDFGTNRAIAELTPYVRYGWVGVHIFFVLSGFVIAYSTETSAPLAFLKSRFTRLYPGAWVCATLTLLVAAAFGEGSWDLMRAWVVSIMLAPYGAQIDGSYWTLRIEMIFYAVVFFLLLCGWQRQLPKVMVGISAYGMLCMGCLLVLQQHWVPANRLLAGFASIYGTNVAQITLVRHGSLFTLGVFLFLCLLRGATPGRIAGVLFCSVGALLSIYFDGATISRLSGVPFSSIPAMVIWATCVVAIIGFVLGNRQVIAVLGQRGAQVARTLGLLTYPLYLLHQHIGTTLLAHVSPKPIPDLPALALVILLLLAVSYLALTYLEKPLQKAVRHVLHLQWRRRDEAAATLP
jgi:peptidoglycan/LPS O-acetylase OafA/YrhL